MSAKLPATLSALTWGAIAAAAIHFILQRYKDVVQLPLLSSALGPDDPDPWLRLVQLRQLLLEKGAFFSHAVLNTNAPDGGIATPWTRPFDLLLLFFYRIMPGEYSLDTSLMLAAAWLPPVLGLLGLFALWKGARKFLPHTHVLWCLALLAALNPVLFHFAPGASDHHSLLVAAWCGVLCLISHPLQGKQGIAAGALLGLMLWTSPEALLLIASVYVILGWEALHSPAQSRQLFLITLSAAVVAGMALFAEMPAAQIFTTEAYDTISLPYVLALSLAAAGAGVLWKLSEKPVKARAAAVGVSAALAAGVMFLFFPKFFKGPLVDVDPFILSDFLPNVVEALPLSKQGLLPFFMHMWQPLLASLMYFANGRRKGRIGALLFVTTAMTLASSRWTYYLQPVSLLMIAISLPGWATAALQGWKMPKLFRPYAVLFAAVFVFFAMVAQVPPIQSSGECRAEMRYLLQTKQVREVLGKDSIILFTSPDIAGQVQFFTPYRIIAGNYHREGKGMRDLKEIATAKREDAREKLRKRKADALFVCPSDYGRKSWLSSLTEKKYPNWLTPVKVLRYTDSDAPKPLIFRIRK